MSFYNENTLAKKRMSAFLDVVDAIIRENKLNGVDMPMKKVYEKAALSKAPCYFVNLDFAARQLTLIAKGKQMTVKSELKKQMYRDIYKHYLSITRERTIKKLNWNILSAVLRSEAKSFYINTDCVQQLINIYYR